MKHKHEWKELKESAWAWCKSCGTLRTWCWLNESPSNLRIRYRYYKPKKGVVKGE